MTNKHRGRKQRRPVWTDPVGVTKQGTAAFHGISVAQVEQMKAKQGGKCAICQTKLTSSAVIDHDHELARAHGHPENRGCRFCIRAMLCSRCNNLLGMAQDSTVILMRAIAYIKLAKRVANGEVISKADVQTPDPSSEPADLTVTSIVPEADPKQLKVDA